MRFVKISLLLFFITFSFSIGKTYVLNLLFEGNEHIADEELSKLLRLKKKTGPFQTIFLSLIKEKNMVLKKIWVYLTKMEWWDL